MVIYFSFSLRYPLSSACVRRMGVLWSSFQLVDNVCHTRSTAKNARVTGRNLITSLATQSYSDLRLRPKNAYLITVDGRPKVLSFFSFVLPHLRIGSLMCFACHRPSFTCTACTHKRHSLDPTAVAFAVNLNTNGFVNRTKSKCLSFSTKNKTSTEIKSVTTARPRDHESRVYIKN